MFLKWTGGLLILFAGSGMGVWLAWGYKKRLSTLENLRRMIYCLKGEIVYSHAPLEEAFERIGKRGLQVAEQKIHPHGHGWSIVNNVDQWSWA